eukprot:NODE_8206_length_1514_cov_11.945926.p1 GENE.NODE_8206_length_1514_cov_11.945926~~NODE_8206_length_1514_cov_11.945926.p1  ORF type:complete len:439 (-),score=137.90 NODE_8206_length_1514_cov_11.945926:3-1319(-)
MQQLSWLKVLAAGVLLVLLHVEAAEKKKKNTWSAKKCAKDRAGCEVAAAGSGDARAALSLARLVDEEGDAERATEWFAKAAKQGNAEAQGVLGVRYHKGLGVKRNDSRALELLRQAADRDAPEALNNLGLYHHMAECGLQQDDGTAFQLFLRSARTGDRDGMYYAGSMYELGSGTPKETPEALRWLCAAADLDHVRAQVQCGLLLKDSKESSKYMRKAAENDDAEAQLRLGLMCSGGHGVGRSVDEAAKWYQRSADGGNTAGMAHLAQSYVLGAGVPIDKTMAAKWYAKAAELGEPYSQSQLGIIYKDGDGLPQDFALAEHWLSQAAEREQASGMTGLAELYRLGKGKHPGDGKEIGRLLVQAAQKGSEEAKQHIEEWFGKGKSDEEAKRDAEAKVKKRREQRPQAKEGPVQDPAGKKKNWNEKRKPEKTKKTKGAEL